MPIDEIEELELSFRIAAFALLNGNVGACGGVGKLPGKVSAVEEEDAAGFLPHGELFNRFASRNESERMQPLNRRRCRDDRRKERKWSIRWLGGGCQNPNGIREAGTGAHSTSRVSA